jgi:UDP-N-acetylglucosamine 2-epimerase (non-hydrolysing)
MSKKKIISVVGARPNFMKVAPIHRALSVLDEFEHVICHTGQHYDANMSDTFFEDLNMPQPKFFLGVGSGSHAEQTAKTMIEFEKVVLEYRPDLVIVVGDVNSTIACTLTAAKCGIKTAHVEAGLRSFDKSMPEELNRMATDAIADYYFVTEQSGIDNLQKAGIPDENIFFVGNTMIDSLNYALPYARKSNILSDLKLTPKQYALITIHRPSNVDNASNLESMLEVLEYLSKYRTVVFPVHPRTKNNIEKYNLSRFLKNPKIQFIDPLGYVNFLALMLNADFVLTDSGGIQEETTAIGVPCLTARTTTERPSTITLGTNILVPPTKQGIINAIDNILNNPRKEGTVPPLWDGKAAERIANVLKFKVFK